MNRSEFITQLRINLKGMSKEEIEDAILYYEEYFDEAGSENESEVIEELGTPNQIAKRIRAEATINQVKEKEGSTPEKMFGIVSIMMLIIGVLISNPILLPLGLKSVILTGGLILMIFAVSITVVAIGVTLAISCVMMMGLSVYLLFVDPLTGICLLGIGCAGLGLDILVSYAILRVVKKLIQVTLNLESKVMNKIKKGEE